MLHAIALSNMLDGRSMDNSSKKLRQAICDVINTMGIRFPWKRVAPTKPTPYIICWYKDPMGLIPIHGVVGNQGTQDVDPKDVPPEEMVDIMTYV